MKSRLIRTLLSVMFCICSVFSHAQIGIFTKVITDTVKAKDYRFQQLPNYSVYGALQNITAGDQNLSTPPGTTAQRPTVPLGKIVLRFNTDSNALEYGNSSGVWKTLGTSTNQTFDTSSISNFYLKVRGLLSGTSPILYNSVTGNISIQQSSSSQAGYLSQADWVTFNAKLPDPGSNGLLARTSAGTTAARQLIAASSNVSIVNPTGVSGNPSLDINDTLTLAELILQRIPPIASYADSVLFLNRSTGLLEVRPVQGINVFAKAGGGISYTGDSLYLNQSFTRGLFSAVSPITYNSSTGAIGIGSKTTDTIIAGGIRTQYILGDTLDQDDYEIDVFPDIQGYTGNSGTRVAPMDSMFNWIVRNRTTENIRALVQVGDLTNQQADVTEMGRADTEFDKVDALSPILPYIPVIGNHDYKTAVAGRDASVYNTYFGPSRYTGQTFYGGCMDGSNENFFILFDGGGHKYAAIGLEFLPRDTALRWAQKIIDSLPDREIILVTHAYTNRSGERATDTTLFSSLAEFGLTDGNNGELMWQKLVRKNPRIFLVLSGHFWWGAGVTPPVVKRITSPGTNANVVYQIVCNYQQDTLSGNGYFMRLKFKPRQGKINVSFYSPYLGYNDARFPSYDLSYPAIRMEGAVGISDAGGGLNVAGEARFDSSVKITGIPLNYVLKQDANGNVARSQITDDGNIVRITTNNTSDDTYNLDFNRTSTAVQGAFNFSTNGTKKWFFGMDNDATDNFYAVGWTSNKYIFKIDNSTGDVKFGNGFTALDIKNDGTSVKVGSLNTGGTAPTTSGTTKPVVTDANGQLSFRDLTVSDMPLDSGKYILNQNSYPQTANYFIKGANIVSENGAYRSDIAYASHILSVNSRTLSLERAATGNTPPVLSFFHNRNSDINTNTPSNNGDWLGELHWEGGAKTTGARTNFAMITSFARVGSTYTGGELSIWLVDSTNGAFSDKFHINSKGYVRIGGSATTNYMLHVQSGDAYFAGNTYHIGNVGIGTTSPTARLHLPAGTASASTAPLKFTAGTNLTTPEDGAVEYDGSHYYGTIGSTRYQLDQQGGGGVTDHGALTGLGDDDHTQYALLAGRSGGQTLIGGTGTTDDMVLQSTSGVGASGADIIFKGGNNGATEFARFLNNGNFGLGTSSPTAPFHLVTSGQLGAQIDMSNTSDGTYAINFNRASTSVENAFNWSTNGTAKWFLGQDNDGTDDMLYYSWAANKIAFKAYSATGNIAFGNSLNALYIKNDGSGIGIGTTSPTAKLHLPAGTATANTAPLKFTSGTNLTTPEAGTMEYDGTDYYVTNSTARYTVSRTLKGSTTWDPSSIGANSSTTTTISVTGAALGDPVVISKTSGSYSNGEIYFAYVSSSGTVTIQLQNGSGGTFDIASATYNVIVLKY